MECDIVARMMGEIGLAAANQVVDDPDGVASVSFAVCKGQRCTWGAANKLGAASGKPYTKVWKAPKRGTFTVLVRVTDRQGNVSVTAVKKIKVGAKATGKRVKAKGSVGPESRSKRR